MKKIIYFCFLLISGLIALMSFQNCSSPSSTVYGAASLPSNSTGKSSISCSPGASAQCFIVNGTGNSVCNSDGHSYGTCFPSSCNPGYILVNGACQANSCLAGSTTSCGGNIGVGTMKCSADGSKFGPCSYSYCSAGYSLDSNSNCSPALCSPGSQLSCTQENGVGTMVCNSNGVGYGKCSLSSCNSGFSLQYGNCLASPCNPGSVASCTFGNGFGNKTCNSQGTGFDACVLYSCSPGFNLHNGLCVSNSCLPNTVASCSTANGSGTMTCDSQGAGYGSCLATTCNSGYNLQNGVCVAQTCTPGSVATCSDGSGSGSKVCNSLGTEYSACTLSSCNSGFTLQNGICVANHTCSGAFQKNPNGTVSGVGPLLGSTPLNNSGDTLSQSNFQYIQNLCLSYCNSFSTQGVRACLLDYQILMDVVPQRCFAVAGGTGTYTATGSNIGNGEEISSVQCN